ncbi:MAG: hypothetical protein DMG08_29185 [Acidobacteria bacterium]|nr:MAG: hypothetical protein DMG08_29185 [Acidobacteriota bacterium]PYU98459.1 MAG: hypothetical protein DMG10_28155 [Acidobacteriota bacterium]PYV32132.1 MAG: hypothetical protein DMG09_24770 [Acidobacteriota bacterium]
MSEAQLVEARTRGEGNVSTLRRKPRKGRKEAAALAETDKVKAQARVDVQAIESKAEVAAFKKEPQELKYTARIRHSSAGKNWKPWRSCPSWPAQEYTSGLISLRDAPEIWVPPQIRPHSVARSGRDSSVGRKEREG